MERAAPCTGGGMILLTMDWSVDGMRGAKQGEKMQR